MTTVEREVVVTVIDGYASRPSHTFKWGEAPPPISIGLQGDWMVSAPGVASIHLWLLFDGRQLYAASVGTGVVYLQDTPITGTWQKVPDRAELRFGQARMRVSSRPVGVLASGAPRRLSPIERAAALPLPSFFSDRLRAAPGRDALPVAPDPRRGRSRGRVPRPVTREAAWSARDRRSRATRLALLLATPSFLVILAVVWLVGFGRQAPRPGAMPVPSARARLATVPTHRELDERATAPPPATAEAPALALPIVTEGLAPPPLAAVEVPAMPTIGETLAPPRSLTSQHRAYPQNVTDRPVPRVGEQPWTISEEWLAQHERQKHDRNRARAKVIFLGDSITEGWGAAPAYRDSFGKYSPLNLGLVGDVTQNVLWRIDQGALAGTQPEVVVVMIGINNLAGGFSPEATVAGIRAIVVAVQARLPSTRLLLLAVLPARQYPTDPLRQRIIEANRLLANLAEPPAVSVHDVGSVLLEPDGSLSQAMTRDFVHPTAAGYERLSQAVAPLIDTLMAHAAE